MSPLKGTHYPLRLYINGVKTRSKFLYLSKAQLKALGKVLEGNRVRRAAVVRMSTGKEIFVAGRTFGRGVVGRRVK